jgi:cephalosporin-C deacetylase
MALFDLPLDELWRYRRAPSVPADLDGFWADTLAEARAAAPAPRAERVNTPLRLVDTYDVTFGGFAGQPVRAWLNVPAGAGGRLPPSWSSSGTAGVAAGRTSGSSGPPPGTPT